MKALIVDDSKVVRDVIAKMLNEFGISSDEAENGKIAFDVVTETKYDVIILDWNMPVMNGMEFLQKAKSEALIWETKIIICTTENEEEKIIEAMQKGANEYIMKPFTKEILEDKFKILGLL